VSDNLEARLAAVEERLGMESGLRASVDRDLGAVAQRMSAANHLIQALAITQAEHTATLAEHTETLADITSTLDGHTATLDGHTATLDGHTATLDGHTDQFVSVQAKLDRIVALMERPIGRDDG
jgi:ABC-type transporter Mla subunit MlaD